MYGSGMDLAIPRRSAVKAGGEPPGLVDRLEKKIRRHILAAVPADASAQLETMDLAGLLHVYGNWRGRLITAGVREANLSGPLREQLRSRPDPRLDRLVEKIEAGEDLTPHLSRAVRVVHHDDAATPHHRRPDLDLLLAAWGIHHLHLGTETEPDGFVARSSELLFALVTASDAYLIGIFDHQSWAKREVLEALVRSWPEAELIPRSRSAIGLSQRYTDEESLQLRNAGLSLAIEIDGSVYLPRGQTMTGIPMDVSRGTMSLLWQLDDWRTDTDERLRRHLDGEFAYWLPAIRDDLCGFADGNRFVSLGPLP
jgi:hypothetical protein